MTGEFRQWKIAPAINPRHLINSPKNSGDGERPPRVWPSAVSGIPGDAGVNVQPLCIGRAAKPAPVLPLSRRGPAKGNFPPPLLHRPPSQEGPRAEEM